MSHLNNSGSEDGQLCSPGDDYYSEEEQNETADSLDIKPPQAAHTSSGRKKSSKDKKHSKDHKHRDRDYMARERQQDRDVGQIDDRRHRHYMRDREHRNHRHEYYNRSEQDYHSRHKRTHDKHLERDLRERDRRQTFDHQYETKDDAERALEDLRTRLLNKRHKYQNEMVRYSEHDSHYENSNSRTSSNAERSEKSSTTERLQRLEKLHHKKEKEYKERKENIIEVIDSPELLSDYSSSKKKEKNSIPGDSEQAARKAKLLEAEREMARRKELAKEELAARREKRRDREGSMSSSQSYNDKIRKRHYEDNNKDIKKHFKKFHENDFIVNKEVVELSDNSDESTDEEDVDSQSESNSHSPSNKSENEEGELPNSPLSIENLSKSEHRQRNKSHSRSTSIRSRSHSHSHSEHSKSDHSRGKSYSLSRPGSDRSTKSRSISKSLSRSRSQSRTRSHSRSRSHSKDKISNKRILRENESDIDLKYEDEIKNESNNVSTKSLKEEEKEEDKLPNYYPGIQGCRSVEEFQCLNRIEEGTYGVVYRAKDKRTNEIVALKRLKMEKEKEGFPITSLREINTLLKGQHPNIVTVREIVVGSNMDKIFIVMDYVEHDLKSLMETMKHKDQSFLPGEVKCLTQQLLRAVAHLHDNWILHRDLKTSNLLLSHKGVLKVGDFGLAREYGSPLKQYTSLVVTLWYRAPELLLCSEEYSTPIDMWSVGCIFAEFLQMGALFTGKSEIDQLNRVFKELGTPNEKIWPGYKELPAVQSLKNQNSHFTEYPVSNLRKRFINKTTELGINLLKGLLTYDPKQRLTAEQALKSPYFKELPLPIDPSMFPTWPAKSELGVRKALASSPKPPSGGSQFKQLGREDNITSVKNNKTGFILNANIEHHHRQVAMAPGFSLKF